MRAPLGTWVHARSGDKGGDANLGLWVGQGPHRDGRVAWLLATVTPDWVRALLPVTTPVLEADDELFVDAGELGTFEVRVGSQV